MSDQQPTRTKQRAAETTIACTECGKTMVVRVNRDTQSEFLGCATYPTCTHTMPLPDWFKLKRAGAAMLPGLGG